MYNIHYTNNFWALSDSIIALSYSSNKNRRKISPLEAYILVGRGQ